MIKISVVVEDMPKLEALVALLVTLDLAPHSLAVVNGERAPVKRARAKPSTKKRTKHSKRRSGRMSVKLVPINSHAVPPRVWAAREAIQKEFGNAPFEKGTANAVIQKALKLKNRPTGMISMLMDAGGLIPA